MMYKFKKNKALTYLIFKIDERVLKTDEICTKYLYDYLAYSTSQKSEIICDYILELLKHRIIKQHTHYVVNKSVKLTIFYKDNRYKHTWPSWINDVATLNAIPTIRKKSRDMHTF